MPEEPEIVNGEPKNEDGIPATAHWVARMVKRIGEKMGAIVNLEPEFGRAGSVDFPGAEKRVFFNGRYISINSLGAVEVAADKGYSSYFLRSFGYNTPIEQTFFSPKCCERTGSNRGVEDACSFAEQIGFPVIVKPNNLSQGAFVIKAHSPEEVRQAAKAIFDKVEVLLVQKFVEGRDYRIVVLDDEVLSAYERVPLHVIGDGKSSIQELLVALQMQFDQQGRDTSIDFEDSRIVHKLAHQGYAWDSVPAAGETIYLLDNSNLSTGGQAIDVTSTIHPDYQALAIQLTKAMGLRLCGVDIMTSDLTQPLDPKYCIIEINAAPGLDHYALSGNAELDDLYAKVLLAASESR